MESFLWIISVVFICLMESEKVLTKIKLYIWIQPSWKITVFRVCQTARGRTQEVNVCLQWLYMKFPGKNQLFRELSSGEPAQSNLQQQFNLRSARIWNFVSIITNKLIPMWTRQAFEWSSGDLINNNHKCKWLKVKKLFCSNYGISCKCEIQLSIMVILTWD